MLPGPQGPAGPAGVTSARGETLPPGSEVEVSLENRVLTVKVPRGDKGDTGDAATVRIGEVTTGEPGSGAVVGAVVGNSGDEHAAILDFTIPKGQKGDKGDGLQIDYTAASSGELPTSGVTEGQTGIVNGELFVWDGSRWVSQGRPTVSGRDGIRVWKQWDDPALVDGNDVREGDLWMMTPHYLTDLDPDSPAEGAEAAEYYTYAEGVPDNSPSGLVMTRQVVVDLLERHLGCWWSLIWRVESSLTPGREETVQETAAVGMLSADPDWQALSAEVDALRIEVDRLKTQTQTQTK